MSSMLSMDYGGVINANVAGLIKGTSCSQNRLNNLPNMPTMEMAEKVMAKLNSRNDCARFSRNPLAN